MGRTAARSIGWSVVDKWGTRLSSLVVILFLGRILDAEAFGVVALATVYTALAAVFVDSGFGRSLVQKDTLTETDKNTAFWTNVLLALLISGLTLLSAPFIAGAMGVPILSPILQVLSLGIFLNGLASAPAALLEREFRFKALAMRRAAGTISGAGISILLAFMGFGVWSLVAQTLVSATVSLVILWLSSDWRPRLSYSFASLRSLRTVGMSVMGIELVAYANSQADKLVIGALMDPESLGYYYIALQITTVITSLFSSVFGNISLTTFSRVQKEPVTLLHWFLRLTSVSSYTAIPFFSLVAASAPTLVPFVLGDQWQGSVPIIQVLALLGVINAAVMFDRNLLISVGQGGRAFRMTLGQAILGIALILPGTQFGVLGVATAVVLRQYLFWPFRLRQVRRAVALKLWPYFRGWLTPVAVGTVSFVASRLVGDAASSLWSESGVAILACQGGTTIIVTLAAYSVLAPSMLRKAISFIGRSKKNTQSMAASTTEKRPDSSI